MSDRYVEQRHAMSFAVDLRYLSGPVVPPDPPKPLTRRQRRFMKSFEAMVLDHMDIMLRFQRGMERIGRQWEFRQTHPELSAELARSGEAPGV